MTVGQFAEAIGRQSSEVIIYLLHQGMACTKNQILPEETVARLAQYFDVSLQGREIVEPSTASTARIETTGIDVRAPIVVVIGHVDHGKTSLLDYIRKTRVALREKGGITQHLGAYKVTTAHGPIVFLDTPGHEAFNLMRRRGIHVADIAILVVAADDGVMPQTVEAIKFAQESHVPIVVALNKIDKVAASRLEEVKTQLTKHGVLVEEWGGDIVCVPISAKEGTGVDKLLEMLSLQAELLELKTTKTGPGIGYVLEAKVEKGRGPVATVILQNGVLRAGDFCIAGTVAGRVTSLVNSGLQRVQEVSSADPVQVSGFDALPQAGDVLRVVSVEEYRQARSQKIHVPSFSPQCDVSSQETINIIIKTDTNSSKDAVVNAVNKIGGKDCKQLALVYAGAGSITENDIALAVTARSTIYGFGVKPEPHVQALAKKMGVIIEAYAVIYQLLDALKAAVEKTRRIEMITKKVGEAVVRKVFNIKSAVIAGCYVKSGKIVKGGTAVVWRGNQKIGEGVIQTLQREKRAMKEVAAGFECGFIAVGLADYQEEDRIECFVQEVKPE